MTIVTGWRRIKSNSDYNTVELRTAEMIIGTESKCKKLGINYNHSMDICLHTANTPIGSCYEDFGTGLVVVPQVNRSPVVLGIEVSANCRYYAIPRLFAYVYRCDE